ncbi:MAG: hypothetical protein NC133_03665 [Prevotella sp.]|nr:hypothetical protein [Prevotella sp.]
MGLLEKATNYHTTTAPMTTPAPKPKRKLSKLLPVFAATALLSLAPQPLQTERQGFTSHQTFKEFSRPTTAERQEFAFNLAKFRAQRQSRVSYEERAMLAQLLYGEAGHGTDPIEVIHTVLNRMSSPLFKGDMQSIITAKNQYVGYDEKHPIVLGYLKMIDMVIKEWEDNGCQPIDDCDRYYFVTGVKGYCNKFEISPDHQGAWVKHSQKKYAPLNHYCATAKRQAKAFYAQNKVDRKVYIRNDIQPTDAVAMEPN